jgi:hypothetical protein
MTTKKDDNLMPGLSSPDHMVYHVDAGDVLPEKFIEELNKIWEAGAFPKKFTKKDKNNE